MSVKTLTLNGTTYTNTVPCDNSDTTVNWSPDGMNIGMSRDYDFGTYPYLWVGINATTNVSTDCGASGSDCIGMARYDLSSPAVSQTYDTNHTFSGTSSAVVDQVGYNTLVAVGEKIQSDVYKWTTASTGGSAISVTPTDLSQMDWMDGNIFGLTAAGTTTCAGSTHGALEIRNRSSGALLAGTTIPFISGGPSKPEGIDIVPVDSGHSGSCHSGKTYVIYVTYYCQDELFVYSWDGTSIWPESQVALPSGCNPSSVNYHDPSGNVIATCQTHGSLVFLTTTATGKDKCNPAWNGGSDEVVMNYLPTGQAVPACAGGGGDNPAVYNACPSGGGCGAHDLAYDDSIASGWVFSNLSDKGQVVVMRASSPHNQTGFYWNKGTYAPYELELGSTP